MSNRPYFPFYPGDYLADTMGMSCCEHGVYVLLLAVSWQRGPLPDDMDHLARLTANPPIEVLRFVLESYWTRTETGWLNARMELEREKVATSFKKRSDAGKKGMLARWEGQKNEKNDNNAITMLYQNDNIQNQNHKHIKDTLVRFDVWWSEYGKKRNRKGCVRVWKSKRLEAKADVLIEDTKKRKTQDRRWLEGYQPDPLTYLNQERWEDEIEPPRRAERAADGPRSSRQWQTWTRANGFGDGPAGFSEEQFTQWAQSKYREVNGEK